MRIFQTTLTYRGDKMHERYQDHKKNFPQVKKVLDFCEELEYIGVCLWEVLDILGSHYKKKFFQNKK